jgi:anti-sigma regulatory factor (Ser/Thr protein kinase)
MFVAAALEEGGVRASSVVEPALLAVSELATNAVQHAGTGFEVLVDTAATVRITVVDDSARLPQLRMVEPWAEQGRGVALVDATADRWGIVRDTHTDGKAVWWEVDLPTP